MSSNNNYSNRNLKEIILENTSGKHNRDTDTEITVGFNQDLLKSILDKNFDNYKYINANNLVNDFIDKYVIKHSAEVMNFIGDDNMNYFYKLSNNNQLYLNNIKKD